jgi:hypothetical protein
MIIINICLNPLGFEIRLCTSTLVLLHTGIEVWGTYGYWLLEVMDAALAGGFPSNPILSGPRQTVGN